MDQTVGLARILVDGLVGWDEIAFVGMVVVESSEALGIEVPQQSSDFVARGN